MSEFDSFCVVRNKSVLLFNVVRAAKNTVLLKFMFFMLLGVI